MRTLKAFLILIVGGGIFTTADAQYYYGPPPGPPPPPPPGYRHHQERQESRDDEGPSQPTGYVALSIGACIPVGNFANEFGGTNTNYTNPPSSVNFPAGYALSGLNFNISLGVPVNHSNLGFAIQYAYGANPFDIGTYTGNLAVTDPYKSYDGGDVNDVYSTSFIMGGLFLTLPVQRLSIDFKLLGGIAICSTPEVAYSAEQQNAVTNNTDVYSWDIAASNSVSFAYGLGADLRYKFRRSSLIVGVDFLSTDVTVNSEEQYTDPNNYYYNTHVGGVIPVSMVNAYIGVAYDIR